jgi:hypothetical protein
MQRLKLAFNKVKNAYYYFWDGSAVKMKPDLSWILEKSKQRAQ